MKKIAQGFTPVMTHSTTGDAGADSPSDFNTTSRQYTPPPEAALAASPRRLSSRELRRLGLTFSEAMNPDLLKAKENGELTRQGGRPTSIIPPPARPAHRPDPAERVRARPEDSMHVVTAEDRSMPGEDVFMRTVAKLTGGDYAPSSAQEHKMFEHAGDKGGSPSSPPSSHAERNEDTLAKRTEKKAAVGAGELKHLAKKHIKSDSAEASKGVHPEHERDEVRDWKKVKEHASTMHKNANLAAAVAAGTKVAMELTCYPLTPHVDAVVDKIAAHALAQLDEVEKVASMTETEKRAYSASSSPIGYGIKQPKMPKKPMPPEHKTAMLLGVEDGVKTAKHKKDDDKDDKKKHFEDKKFKGAKGRPVDDDKAKEIHRSLEDKAPEMKERYGDRAGEIMARIAIKGARNKPEQRKRDFPRVND